MSSSACTAPARIFGMYRKKGVIAAGHDADIVLWDPKADYTITAATQNMATDYSMFEGWKVKGNARQVFSRGELVVEDGKWIAADRARPVSSSAKPRRSMAVIRLTRLGHRCTDVQHDPRLYNADLAPTTPAQRTWSTYNYIALWFSMSMEVTTYMLASSLIAGGMNWKQAVFTILLGNLIVLVPMLLNAHAGAKYGIPFPVFVRASFGARGANIPAMLRALVACGWFGIQSWLGGQAIAAMIDVLWPATAHNARRSVGELSRLLAAEYVRGVARRGVDPLSAELLRALHAGDVAHAALLDAAQGRRLWAHAFCAQPLPHDRQLSSLLLSVADGDGGLLGDALAEYPRLHPLRQDRRTRRSSARRLVCRLR